MRLGLRSVKRIVKPFTVKYKASPDLSMMSDTMDYSFQGEFILSENPKTFIQKFQDILVKPANSTKDTYLFFLLLLVSFTLLNPTESCLWNFIFVADSSIWTEICREQKAYSTCVVYCVKWRDSFIQPVFVQYPLYSRQQFRHLIPDFKDFRF